MGMSSDEGSPGASASRDDGSPDPLVRRNEFLREAYREHRSAIYELASRVCGADRAAEVTQEVFLRLWKHPERFDPQSASLRQYLLTSAHDVAIDFLRREIARYRRDIRDDRTSNRPDSAIEAELHALEESAKVAEALSALNPGERDAILGAFYSRASYRAVAAASGLPADVIRSRIRRGLLRMEKALRRSSLAMIV